LDENSFDANRFEQELIYYFEKLDITEEIVRLETQRLSSLFPSLITKTTTITQ
jgi:uncharacterized protein YicC (UPF0701 family)